MQTVHQEISNFLFGSPPRNQTLQMMSRLHLQYAYPASGQAQRERSWQITEQIVRNHQHRDGVTLFIDYRQESKLHQEVDAWFDEPYKPVFRASRFDTYGLAHLLPLNPLKAAPIEDLLDYYEVRFGKSKSTDGPQKAFLETLATRLREQGEELSFPLLSQAAIDESWATAAQLGTSEDTLAQLRKETQFGCGLSHNLSFGRDAGHGKKQEPIDVFELLRKNQSVFLNLSRGGDEELSRLLLADLGVQWAAAKAEGTWMPELLIVLCGGGWMPSERYIGVTQPRLKRCGIGLHHLTDAYTTRSHYEQMYDLGWVVGAFPDFDNANIFELRNEDGVRRIDV